MGFTIDFSVLNQKGTPALYSDIFANRPAAGYQGRLFIATDTAAIYEDTGTAWTLIANVSSGAGTLQQVTTNGNTSNVGISVTAGGVSTNSATITSLTTGSVPFAGAGGLISQDNANLFWDDTNNRLGINTNTPGNSLDVHGISNTPLIALNNTASNQSLIGFAKNSSAKWRIGNSLTDTFDIINVGLSTNAISISNASNCVSFLANLLIKQGTGFQSITTFNGIACDAGGFFFQLDTSTNVAYLNFIGLTAARTFTFPDAAGTLALTSNLSAYLLLAGGTLTGALGGTTASFSGLITSTVGNGGTLLKSTSATTGLQVGVDLRNTGGLAQFAVESSVGGTLATGSTAYATIFGSGNNTNAQIQTNGTVRATVSSGGNFLIGSTTDDTVNKLQVTGNIVSKSTGNPFFGSQKNGGSTYGFYSDGAGSLILVDFGIAVRGNFNMGTGIYTPTSDINKKKDFELSSLGLNAILGLKPTLYRMKEDKEDSPKYLGFLAQEVKEFIPQSFVEKDDFIGLDYQSITATLVKAVQEQQSIIDGLLKRIELLENK